MGDDDCFEPEGSSAAGGNCLWAKELSRRLPLDEDYYLVPSSQPRGLTTLGPANQQYMELVTDESGK